MRSENVVLDTGPELRPRLKILAMAADEWGAVLYSRHQLLLRISRQHDVLYSTGGRFVRELGCECLSQRALWGRFEKRGAVTIDVAPCIPFRNWRSSLLDRWALSGLARRLQRRWEACEGGPRVLWLFHPSFRPYVDFLDYDRLIYHPHDRFSAMPGASPELAVHERQLCEMADVRIATSQVLADAMKRISGARFEVLTNGVDYRAYADAADGVEPPDLAAIPHPRIGYTGVMNQKVDFALIRRLAIARPDWHFVMVGKVDFLDEAARREVARCAELNNMHFLGPRPQAAIAGYVAGLDIGLIPYRTGEAWSEAGNPLKLYEYLAVGIPAVSSSIKSVEALGDLVRFPGESVEAWIAALAAGLQETGSEARSRRQAAARARDWNVLAAQALQMVWAGNGISSRRHVV